ncbi:MAG TPA: MATE family efflux transporter [Candidatus Fimadaptatus faecigallinarum]|uniref:Probable multidrug resistance protein NorM n=1 Tax=Candidatus Fimadaptatus faecigallinarum TaxID=2840814 RepID=A0A9D1LT85_9FIRM|nr:MATE family efflux transporter [Candidatus Fimadaptatus faecigallinarum]
MNKAGRIFKGRQHDIDMTEGSVFWHILTFALPLLVGNIFQQMYNMVDTWVVGNYVSAEAFAAVGNVGPIINTLIGLFTGLASGAGVVISQYYGAHDYKKVHDAVHTAIMLTIILTVAMTIIGIAMTPWMLNFMKMQGEVYNEAKEYLTIYFAGIIGLLFYNMCAGILRAVGDSKRPFNFLLVAAVTNTVLDLVFVIVFGMGVAGVAYATIIAQALSASLTMVTLMRSHSCVRVILRDIRIHMEMLKKTIRVGIPAALQMAVTAFSNVFVQSYINQFGTYYMGGWTAYSKIDQLIFLPMQSLALSATTFVGQNLGKGQIKRAKYGARMALGMAMGITVLVTGVVMIVAPYLVEFFNDEPDVVRIGAMFLRWLTPFYVFSCVNQVYSGALRGAGDSRAPMIIMLGSFVVFRQIYLYVVSTFISNTILPLAMSYPAGWLVCSVLTLAYYRRANLGSKRLVDDNIAVEESAD